MSSLQSLSSRALPYSRYLAAPMTLLALTRVAAAQAVAGSVDPETGLAALAPYLLILATAAIVITCMYKGAHAVMEGRSFGPIVAGLVAGLALTFGGYYVLTNYGATGTI